MSKHLLLTASLAALMAAFAPSPSEARFAAADAGGAAGGHAER
jgi:hypothetical protein